MTTKTYFMRSFNFILNLLLIAPILYLFGWLFNSLSIQLNTNTLFKLETVTTITDKISSISYGLALICLSLSLVLIGIEIVKRWKTDRLVNYVKSVYHTFSLRNFLFQREKVQKVTSPEHQTVPTSSPVNNGFNRAVRKCMVDIQTDSVTIFIKVPRDQQGQKILKDMEALLKEEIASQHTDYYFSSPIRVRNQLWFIGKKR
ncbi:TPA: hypothetical protein ACIKR3_001360 [Streptococcus agalactiae]|uniref:hypothetical protein n=1 Tax=Streptococcus agalactiae TaxID=1311 RepID=UPI0002B9D362|nr:hypothetical protein [Streptococcus agalactiae]EPU99279.1 hypothetical protein SAG0324_00290 [Streptococcus agalactiae GB00300]MCY7249734.1 hypothetical protein [Streptococcus agalactiae]TQC13499.1 hypothetical protein DAD61_00865 [Streptococcus agalactiae]TQC16661.1 hypothetical protein DAD62_05820 [Streptococcus agalactiae]TQC19468.1 hypothetical protein DAD63_00120 [Streptococcus agalactiae]